ncbi:MAG TPA: NADP-dependent oxidoreductase [Actinomycetota bacterium]|nr:NADP-dependent oxidoreductase [Actinomycetota bacterium]
MKAFAIDEFGQPGSLHDVPVPEPAEGEVRVRVAAAGLNPFDNAVVRGNLKHRMKHGFPLVPGMDGSGTVDAVGSGVSAWSVGDEVFGSLGKGHLGEGTLAELVSMSVVTIARKPSTIEHATAAAIPTAGVTALNMADALALGDGQTVVAVGATGGVGSYLVQLAVRRGARVVVVSQGENADYARRLGAADVVDYTAGDVAEAVRSRYPDGIDAIADMHGDRDGLARLAEQVRSGGHVASIVGAVDASLADRGIQATNVMGRVTTESLEALSGMMEAGEIAAPEIRSFSLAEAGDGLAAVATHHVRGKIVVTVS